MKRPSLLARAGFIAALVAFTGCGDDSGGADTRKADAGDVASDVSADAQDADSASPDTASEDTTPDGAGEVADTIAVDTGADTLADTADNADTADSTAPDADTAEPDVADTTAPDAADTAAPDAADTAVPDTTTDATLDAGVDTAVSDTAAGLVTWDDVYPIFATSCTPCHTGNTPTSGSGHQSIASTNKAVAYDASQLPATIAKCQGKKIGECALIRIQDGSMPATGECREPVKPKCPDASEQALIQQWITDGMLE